MEISLNGHFLVGYDFFQIICLLPKNKNVVQLRKVVIEGMSYQLPSSKEFWRKLLELLLLHSGLY